MSRRFVVVAEDRLSFAVATALCDRVLADRSEWLRDHWTDEVSRRSFRVWAKLDSSSHEAWTTRADVKRLWGSARAHPLGHKGEGALAYKAAKLALRRAAEDPDAVAALFIIHDTDGAEGAGDNMLRGAAAALESAADVVLVVGAPHPEIEAWVAAGIVPESPEEEARYANERQRLGFDPIEEPHRLSAGKSTHKKDAKRTCAKILGGEHAENGDRWARCWEATPLAQLEERGAEAGLRAYTKQVEEGVLPLLGDRAVSKAR